MLDNDPASVFDFVTPDGLGGGTAVLSISVVFVVVTESLC